MKYILLLIVLLFPACNRDTILVTDKVYVSEHVVHITTDFGLEKKFIESKYYIFNETRFSIQRCEVSKETWLILEINKRLNLKYINNCTYGATASIKVF